MKQQLIFLFIISIFTMVLSQSDSTLVSIPVTTTSDSLLAPLKSDTIVKVDTLSNIDTVAKIDTFARVDTIVKFDSIPKVDTVVKIDTFPKADTIVNLDTIPKIDTLAKIDTTSKIDTVVTIDTTIQTATPLYKRIVDLCKLNFLLYKQKGLVFYNKHKRPCQIGAASFLILTTIVVIVSGDDNNGATNHTETPPSDNDIDSPTTKPPF